MDHLGSSCKQPGQGSSSTRRQPAGNEFRNTSSSLFRTNRMDQLESAACSRRRRTSDLSHQRCAAPQASYSDSSSIGLAATSIQVQESSQADRLRCISQSRDRSLASRYKQVRSPGRNTAPGISRGSRMLPLLKEYCSAHHSRTVLLHPISTPSYRPDLLLVSACSDDRGGCNKSASPLR